MAKTKTSGNELMLRNRGNLLLNLGEGLHTCEPNEPERTLEKPLQTLISSDTCLRALYETSYLKPDEARLKNATPASGDTIPIAAYYHDPVLIKAGKAWAKFKNAYFEKGMAVISDPKKDKHD